MGRSKDTQKYIKMANEICFEAPAINGCIKLTLDIELFDFTFRHYICLVLWIIQSALKYMIKNKRNQPYSSNYDFAHCIWCLFTANCFVFSSSFIARINDLTNQKKEKKKKKKS